MPTPRPMDEDIPLTPSEIAFQKALQADRIKQVLRSKTLLPYGAKGERPYKEGVPRANYVNNPIVERPRKGVRSRNAANIEDLRFLEGHPDRPEFAQGLELLNRHRSDRGMNPLDTLGVANEYPTSLASMMILDREKDRKFSRLDELEKILYGTNGGGGRRQTLYQWGQPGASIGVTPQARHDWR